MLGVLIALVLVLVLAMVVGDGGGLFRKGLHCA